MTSAIYDQHDKAFNRVSAFVVAKDGERVATVAIKFPADGAGRLYAYVHWLGLAMVRGAANGYGYDKRSAAVADAADKIGAGVDLSSLSQRETAVDDRLAFQEALRHSDGTDWTRALEKAGFTVWQAV